jgi:hypothetical protein
MVPRTDSLVSGDVFLVRDGKSGAGNAPIVFRWATCATGVYPHMISIKLFRTSDPNLDLIIANTIEDTGTVCTNPNLNLTDESFLFHLAPRIILLSVC